jgi:hypothetical protein
VGGRLVLGGVLSTRAHTRLQLAALGRSYVVWTCGRLLFDTAAATRVLAMFHMRAHSCMRAHVVLLFQGTDTHAAVF